MIVAGEALEDSLRAPLLARTSDPGLGGPQARTEFQLDDTILQLEPEPPAVGSASSALPSSQSNSDVSQQGAAPIQPQQSTEPGPNAVLRASVAQEALDGLALFSTNEEDEEEDDDASPGSELWWVPSRGFIAKVIFNLISAGVLAAGILLRVTKGRYPLDAHLFRWLLFIGTWAPVWMVVECVMEFLFELIELYYFQDTLAYLESLQHTSAAVVFVLIEIIWFHIVFLVMFCSGTDADYCGSGSYQDMIFVTTRVMYCLALFCFASWLSSVLAKTVSTHFYKTTHFRKIQDALEKEYFLQALSAPKRQVIKKRMERLRAKGKGKTDEQVQSQFHRRTPSSTAMSRLGAEQPNSIAERAMQRRAGELGIDVDRVIQGAGASSNGRVRPFVHRELPTTRDDLSGRPPRLIRATSYGNTADAVVAGSPARPSPPPPPPLEAPSSPPPSLVPDPTESMEVTHEMLQVANQTDDTNEATLADLKDENKLERLRTAVVVKTYSKLINHYKYSTAETEQHMVKKVKAFSKALFKNLVGTTSNLRDYATQEDFNLFFFDGPEGRVQAAKAFDMFDSAVAGRVSRTEIRNTVMNIFRERADIAASLVDTDSVVQSLEQGFGGMLHFLFIGLYLLIWNINLVAGFTTFSATLVGLSFVFGNSIRTMFESILFLFSEHPFDVGDYVMIDNNLYQIKKVRLLFTQMTNIAGHPAYFSNADLHTKQIDNWSRSTSQTDFSYIEVDVGLASEFKRELLSRLSDHIRAHPMLYVGIARVHIAKMMQAGLKSLLQISFTINCAADDFDKRDLGRDGVYQIVSDMMGAHRGNGIQYTAGAVQMYNVHTAAEAAGGEDIGNPYQHEGSMGHWAPHGDAMHLHAPVAVATTVLHS